MNILQYRHRRIYCGKAMARAESGLSGYRNGWISEERMREIAQPMLKNQYGQYLLKVIDEMKEEKSQELSPLPTEA